MNFVSKMEKEYKKIEKNDPICPVKNNIKINLEDTNDNSKLMKINVLHSL